MPKPILFLCYPGCSTCAKARKWLEENGILFAERNIKTENPTAAELGEWIPKSGVGSRKFFNTSGQIYRQMELKDKLEALKDEERIALLATDGMLVKRPIAVGDSFVLVGFRPEKWAEALLS